MHAAISISPLTSIALPLRICDEHAQLHHDHCRPAMAANGRGRDDFCAFASSRRPRPLGGGFSGIERARPNLLGLGERERERERERESRVNKRTESPKNPSRVALFISRGESVAESKPTLFIFVVDTAVCSG